ncbi:kinase-like protein [Hypoxylon trugodes]|uniref:kinase-like protein n=1 Tax=Hypoxylon trugodes TaxID=326681 RepID=UPI00218CFE05|nr:kinase-like protein [Hypoxylon trugodes]KAI1392959.1 kinase-like protein [Hypoxylon trugodes]
MASILKPGQILKGRLSTYSLVKELYKSTDNGVVNCEEEKCILKSVPKHWRLQNESAILKQYQSKTTHLRPLLDEIQQPSEPSSIVLQYLDTDLLSASNKERLSRPKIKQVAKSILEAPSVFHKDELVHTKGQLIGAAISRSPEAAFQLHWGTATDIWSFGNAILSLIYGGDYHLFNPAIEGYKLEDEEYLYTVLKRMYKFFGPFPKSYDDFKDPDVIRVVNALHLMGPPEKPFHLVTSREISPVDKEFVLKIMKLDPRDRPTAEQLLADDWFTEESEDTRVPL